MATAKVDKTKRVLARMLTENTGTHFLDSGGTTGPDGKITGGYGRNWERNQGRDFEAEPAGSVEFRVYNGQPDITVSLSVYHWLADRLEYDASLDRRFRRWANRPSHASDGWLLLAEQFAEHLGKTVAAAGLYGDGRPFTVNTYNGEDLLSQVLQYVYFELDGEPYILLQVHGGCDVRGGYTRPYAFRVLNDGANIFDNARATIECERVDAPDPNQIGLDGIDKPDGRPHQWDTDDGYHWYRDGSSAGTQLEEYEATEDPSERSTDKLYVDDDHNGYCPICGGKLGVWSR